MKALILNSGLGKYIDAPASDYPKCMTEISLSDTILSRQLRMICEAGIEEVIITTGHNDIILKEYCKSLELPLKYVFVKNPVYECINYIYSIYLARDYLDDDILILHGDLIFEKTVFDDVVASNCSCMTVSSTMSLSEKGFKAVIENERIIKIGTGYFNNAYTAQPFYMLKKAHWRIWLNRIIEFCESGKTECYAEKAFNKISDICYIMTLDIKDRLCTRINKPEELYAISFRLHEIENRRKYPRGGSKGLFTERNCIEQKLFRVS